MKIDLEEAPYLALSLNIQLQPHGIEVDTDLFVHMVQEDNSFENILRFCKDVLYPEFALKQQADKEAAAAAALAEEKDEDDLFLEGYLGDTINRQSSVSEKFRSFIREMSNLTESKQDLFVENMDCLEDRLAMIIINEKYTRGSVAVARERKGSLLPGKLVTSQRRIMFSKVVNEAFRLCEQCHITAEERRTIGRASF